MAKGDRRHAVRVYDPASSLPMRGSWVRRSKTRGKRNRNVQSVVVNVGSGHRPDVLFAGWGIKRSYWSLMDFSNRNQAVKDHSMKYILQVYCPKGTERVTIN